GAHGVDVVCDPVGGATAIAAVKSLAWGGRHLVIGFAAGEIPKVPANLLLLKSADLRGVLWGAALKRDPAAHAANIREILAWIAQGDLRPNIETTFPLEQTAAAIAHVLQRRARGKVVVTVTSTS
ncbi:MAG TPA: zinc-binding dehydrogenase, partial [Nevskiaceae bacterium]|nr:zinc-binding dehydrogenase [Nevskiaceae bacterium]